MSRAEVIAEVGVNHNGDLEEGRVLVTAAKHAGADAVKFQASVPDQEISRRYANGDFELISRLILSHQDLDKLAAHADSIGMNWFCTPAEIFSLAWMISAQCKRIKISSDNLTNLPFLREVGMAQKPVILSTGMATMSEIGLAMSVLLEYLAPPWITVLHCTSSYPCSPADANLKAIPTLRRALPEMVGVGWSDHTDSLSLAAVAVAMGAEVIEKHLTMDKAGDGPDHASSATPDEFRCMVDIIRETEAALGDGVKRPRACESECIEKSRKSIVAARAIPRGEKFSTDNLAVKRPGTGRSPLEYFELLRQFSGRDYEPDEMIL